MDDTTKPDFAAADRDAPLMAASKSGAYYDDERNLARAYLASRAELATVQAERDAAKARIVQLEAEMDDILRVMREVSDKMPELHAAHLAELAALRETLVGEVEAERNPHGPSNCTLCEIKLVCHEQWMATAHNAALDRAITIIKGTP